MSEKVFTGEHSSGKNKWLGNWPEYSLAKQFTITSTIVLLGGMAIIGSWVAGKIQSSVTQNTAVATALYIDSFVAPLLQELATQDNLTVEHQRSLTTLMTDTAIGNRIAAFKIWKPGGLIVFSNRKSIIGKTFPVTENLSRALAGTLATEFDRLEDEEDVGERAENIPFLETYSPIRHESTGRVIAVAEFYGRAELFQQDLYQAKLQSWLVVGVVTMLILGLLFIIVRRGSRTIDRQESALKNRIIELSVLRNRLKNASRRSTELNEHFLRRVGSDLHDGPAQLLGLALLRLDAIKQLVTSAPQIPTSDDDDLIIVQNALNDALADIRNISAGLVLPELDGLTLTEILTKAVTIHDYRTHTSTDLNLGDLPTSIGESTQICLYRLVQEGLNNADRHAPGAASSISAKYADNIIEVEVSDAGPGFDPTIIAASSSGLGLPGLRERIESIGGQFEIRSATGGLGTQLIARFAVSDLEIEDD